MVMTAVPVRRCRHGSRNESRCEHAVAPSCADGCIPLRGRKGLRAGTRPARRKSKAVARLPAQAWQWVLPWRDRRAAEGQIAQHRSLRWYCATSASYGRRAGSLQRRRAAFLAALRGAARLTTFLAALRGAALRGAAFLAARTTFLSATFLPTRLAALASFLAAFFTAFLAAPFLAEAGFAAAFIAAGLAAFLAAAGFFLATAFFAFATTACTCLVAALRTALAFFTTASFASLAAALSVATAAWVFSATAAPTSCAVSLADSSALLTTSPTVCI